MLIQDILKIYRNQNNLTQGQLAEKINVTTQAVSKWESGQSIPSIDNLIILSDFYNVSVDQLIKGSPFFKKPYIVGKKFSYLKGIVFLIIWTFVSLFVTGFGYQPLWIFMIIMLVGLIFVFPTVFKDYWIIDNNDVKNITYSDNVFRKIIQLITRKPDIEVIEYSSIKTVELVYSKKNRSSVFDFYPDYFYLLINNKKLNLEEETRKYIPQFLSFLERKGIKVVDKNNIVRMMIENKNIFEEMNK